jgi:hypothetical protein
LSRGPGAEGCERAENGEKAAEKFSATVVRVFGCYAVFSVY